MSVNYCVGMVVELQREGCVGVIRGWDAECDPAQIHAGAVTMSMARKRPGWAFYHVLVGTYNMERLVAYISTITVNYVHCFVLSVSSVITKTSVAFELGNNFSTDGF